MTHTSSPDAARDEANLQALRDARNAGDVAGERDALARLLAPYWLWGRSIAYAKINGVPNRAADAEEIAQELMRRLVKALNAKLDFQTAFHVVAAKNLGWAIRDYWRARGSEKAFPLDPHTIAEDEAIAPTSEDAAIAIPDQARAFGPYLDGLSARDRELVIERIFLDITPAQIANRHGMSRGALDTAMHRLLSRLRQSPQLEDVRKRREATG
ncbi:MAG TPA: sigma-70 family RNA polymerase sigma factor [Solirubrobacteraceae bacterium]|nr:sigma-70 family RNA polymerase sigma factor [Solirubrobacteraceae bacterium]